MSQFYLETLAPIHIGCDEVYEPMEFLVDESACEIVRFDPEAFFVNMGEDDRRLFSKICKQGEPSSILEIYKFFRGKTADGSRVSVCKGFIEQYDETVSQNSYSAKEINDFIIERTLFLPDTGRPYIPGSSIKGAIKTAYLNLVANIKHISPKKGKFAYSDLEKDLLNGKFDADPFSMLKISDFRPVGSVQTKIIYAVNEKKIPLKGRPGQLHQVLEVILPGSIFVGTIKLDQPHRGSRVRSPLSMQILSESMNTFFKEEKLREDIDLTRIGAKPIINKDMQDANLLRIGRHSGAECITVNGHRRIKIMQGKGKRPLFDKNSTTLWLASETKSYKQKDSLKPFGWALLKELDEVRSKDFITLEDEWKAQYLESLRRTLEIKNQRQKELAHKRNKEQEELEAKTREEERVKAEEEEKKAKLAAMTPEERDIWAIKSGNILENQVIEIYNKLDDFQDKFGLALALKEYWIKKKKWKKKECSKKQILKVQTIKDILGE